MTAVLCGGIGRLQGRYEASERRACPATIPLDTVFLFRKRNRFNWERRTAKDVKVLVWEPKRKMKGSDHAGVMLEGIFA